MDTPDHSLTPPAVPVVRPDRVFPTLTPALILTVAGLSKATFVLLILVLGRSFLGHQAGVAVVSDLIQISLFLGYLLAAPRGGEKAA